MDTWGQGLLIYSCFSWYRYEFKLDQPGIRKSLFLVSALGSSLLLPKSWVLTRQIDASSLLKCYIHYSSTQFWKHLIIFHFLWQMSNQHSAEWSRVSWCISRHLLNSSCPHSPPVHPPTHTFLWLRVQPSYLVGICCPQEESVSN